MNWLRAIDDCVLDLCEVQDIDEFMMTDKETTIVQLI